MKPAKGGDDRGMTESKDTLGWQVGVFALERISPEPNSGAGSSAIWESYCNWCEGRNAVPLAFSVFHAEFDKVAEATGIVRRQVGAHVLYEGIALGTEKGS
ncbi:hypothetical protein [Hyphomicrobium sp.]|uniref:hypothetical protein n=1 Tax=Hyphomicrobium sp. TaxID=82 RepID=UPI002E3658D1|nr:hypothetical protein [Hyphomicrobium sp.]HEX2842150.1 hypothetical protein [Hyphomicrobium sp.]